MSNLLLSTNNKKSEFTTTYFDSGANKISIVIYGVIVLFLLYIQLGGNEGYNLTFQDFAVEDCPNDGGKAFCIIWRRFDNEKGENKYKIYTLNEKGESFLLEEFSDDKKLKTELREFYGKGRQDKNFHGLVVKKLPWLGKGVEPGTKGRFFVEYISSAGQILAKTPILEAKTKINWFHTARIFILIFIIIFLLLLLYFISIARKGKTIFIRKIPGLDAIDDAIGRATEMGKPILFCSGLGGVSALSTIASLSIFGEIIKKIAQYGTKILVPNYDPIVMVAAKEVAKNSYLSAGRPDLYRDRDIFFVTSNQFGYVASVNALMVREQTATNLYLGSFAAEALLLSETGAANRSIQIAGTDSVAQLPFFVVTCDYTLIGEELYAAGTYISKEPVLISTLKVQDIFKIIIFAVILIESILNSFNFEFLKYLFYVS